MARRALKVKEIDPEDMTDDELLDELLGDDEDDEDEDGWLCECGELNNPRSIACGECGEDRP